MRKMSGFLLGGFFFQKKKYEATLLRKIPKQIHTCPEAYVYTILISTTPEPVQSTCISFSSRKGKQCKPSQNKPRVRRLAGCLPKGPGSGTHKSTGSCHLQGGADSSNLALGKKPFWAGPAAIPHCGKPRPEGIAVWSS